MKLKLVIALLLLLGSRKTYSQEADTAAAKSTFFPIPVVFFTPETRWGFGGAAFYSWRFRDEPLESRPSQITFGAVYTLENQVLLYLPFQLWLNNGEYSIFGETGWYRYNYFFFGTGNNSDVYESYGVDFPRLRLSGIKRFYPHFYGGLRFIYDDFEITETEEGGALARGNIPGSNGGLISALGGVLIYDSRDNYFESHKGWYGELSVDRSGSYIGSHFYFTRFRFDLRRYLEVDKKNHFVLRMYSERLDGVAPFISQPILGGGDLMRGFYEGRYRDNASLVYQMEYRLAIGRRFGAVAFGAMGAVAEDYSQISTRYARFTYGLGARFAIDPEDRINLRLDAGVGEGEVNFYLTIGEAF